MPAVSTVTGPLAWPSGQGLSDDLVYQSHSVTLTCVDRDSYQSRLGLTTL